MNSQTEKVGFTPGPWYLQYDEIVDAPGGFSIASVLTHNNRKETNANARLIAAAPQMYEALRTIADAYRTRRLLAPNELQSIAEAAIAAAEGH